MFLKLYLLGAALALMPLSTAPPGPQQETLFPYISRDITNTTFPFDLNVTTNSDMVLVKCPNLGYRHKNNNESFAQNPDVFISGSIYSTSDNSFAWVPLLKSKSGPTKLKCGEINLRSQGNPYYDWTFNVKWINNLTTESITKYDRIQNSILRSTEKCGGDSVRTKIFASKKEGGFKVVDDHLNVQNVYVNQMYYYFVEPKKKEAIKEPCTIIKAYNLAPEIVLPDYRHSAVIETNEGITNIGIAETEGKTIKISLELGSNSEYYSGEKISLTRMRYVESGPRDIENSNESVISNFTIKGYDIVKLVYLSPYEGNFKNVTKKYYFSPKLKNITFEMKTESYFPSNSSVRPNCTRYYLTIGYLHKISYNGTEGSVNTLDSTDGIKGNFNETESHIFFKENADGKTTISCIYKTLDGTIKTITNFVNEDTIAYLDYLREQRHLNETMEYNRTLMLNQIALEENSKKVKSMNDTLRKTSMSLNQTLHQHNRSLFQKFSDKVGERNAYVLTAGFILLILIILAVIFVILYKKWLGPFLIMLKYKKKYPNVYVFWDNLTSESFDTYCKTIRDKKYLADKVLNRKVVKKMEGGEEVDVGISDLFDGTLVNCYKNMPMKIKAHYMYTDTENRKYILSDGLTKDTQSSFWQMIYEEDIGTIVAIIYNKKTEDNDDASEDLYWKKDKAAFNDIVVTCSNMIKVNVLSVTGYKILLEKKGGPSKELEIYHISNWKENDIPQTDLQFVSVYQEIFKKAPKKNILVHSSQGTGARVYMLTYFACIYDALKSDQDIDCPFKVIKKMREQRYGGNLVPYEFAYLIKALVSTFFRNGILIDFSQRRIEFNISYDDFFYSYLKRKDKMDAELRKFLDFVNIVDKGKIYEYRSVFYMLGRMDPKTLLNYTKRFQIAVKNHTAGIDKRRFRYGDIPCLDAHGITVNGKPEADKDSFIHANKFEYTTVDKKTRKMILCQAPLDETVDDMLDMILRYKVTVVVVLVKPEEAADPHRKWVPYFPTQTHTLETANFSVLRMKIKELDKHFISEVEYQLRSKKGLPEMNFTILHYQGWPDKSIPSEHKSIYSLYKRIISVRTDDYVAIHCSAGIGRTGTLALIMYLIDTINYFPTFDPIERLKCLREHRYLAVQKYNQFVFALVVVFEHYKKQIDDMDADAYDKFLEVAENLYKKEKEIEDKAKKAMEEKRKKRDEKKRKK
uniref:Tyrosine-protein phosphatase domain-containing protein n=1 Tax=Strongyloides papillosus TaxID=174720 RepID=A0A0N5BFX0_STREA